MQTLENLLDQLENNVTIDGLEELIDQANTDEEIEAIIDFGQPFLDSKLREAVEGVVSGTQRFLNVTDKILKLIEKLDRQFVGISALRTPAEAPVLNELIVNLSGVLRLVHDREGLLTTYQSDQDIKNISSDEASGVPAITTLTPLPIGSATAGVLRGPVPIKSHKYEELADEYILFFLSMDYKKGFKSLIKTYALKAMKNRTRYETVGNKLGIPWWFIAVIHLLESSCNFQTHLHNGDSLTEKTVRVPSGRPKSWNPPNSWEASAIDALRQQGLAGLDEWSLPRALWRLERYNGFGYRSRSVPTPYLWSFSSIYIKGKYTSDGRFSGTKVSKQCGCATLLKYLHNEGFINIGLDLIGDDEMTNSDSDSNALLVVMNGQPNIDNEIPDVHPFQTFFDAELPNLTYFKWHEFLVKGTSNNSINLNSDPPRHLWKSVLPLVRVLEEFRERVGFAVVLTSVYRSLSYNTKIGGATRSQHMAFTAADFKVVGDGATTTKEWAELMLEIRSEGFFKGGIGVYNTFVHVDVRGTRAYWDNRTG
jgi:lysozyme family protein